MSKKPQKTQTNPKKPQIVDQQNQPFLKAISKRIRNINKKLQEITQLQKRGQQLKPQQIQKINRKAELQDQKKKLQNNADFYREVYAENVQQYRNAQLQQLDNLGQAIAVLRLNANFKQADKLSQLNRALTQPSNLSLQQSAKYVSEVLRRFANDFKLKKSLTSFVTQVQPEEKQQQKPVSVVAKEEPVPEVKTQQPVQQVVIPPPVVQVTVQQHPPVQEVKPVQTPVVNQTKANQSVDQVKTEEQKQPAQNGEEKPSRQHNRTRGNYRNRGPRVQGQQGGYRKQGGERRRYDNNNQDRRQRPNYRPKENQPQQARHEDSDSDSSLQQQAVRDFKRQQVKELVQQGFTVVGKPKPKAKEGQKKWHEHTHGRKDHHGHQKGNY